MIKVISLCLVMLSMTIAVAQKQHMVLNMPSLKCKKTTEDGADEVYQLLVWKKSHGTQGQLRIPGAPARWRAMNDGVQLNNDLNWGDLLAFDLEPGQRIDILGMVMESDEGTTDMYNNFGVELFRTRFFADLNNGQLPSFQLLPNILNRIAGTFHLKNADDWIGGYICTFQLTPQGLQKNYRVAYCYTNHEAGSQDPVPTGNANTTTYKFAGDGSSYVAKLNLRVFVAPGR